MSAGVLRSFAQKRFVQKIYTLLHSFSHLIDAMAVLNKTIWRLLFYSNILGFS